MDGLVQNYVINNLITPIADAEENDIEKNTHKIFRDPFMYAPSQWEMTLHCNVISHWLGISTKRSLDFHDMNLYTSPVL